MIKIDVHGTYLLKKKRHFLGSHLGDPYTISRRFALPHTSEGVFNNKSSTSSRTQGMRGAHLGKQIGTPRCLGITKHFIVMLFQSWLREALGR